MSVRLGTLADDLTGADAFGARLAGLGLPSILTSHPAALAGTPADLPPARPGAEVVHFAARAGPLMGVIVDWNKIKREFRSFTEFKGKPWRKVSGWELVFTAITLLMILILVFLAAYLGIVKP